MTAPRLLLLSQSCCCSFPWLGRGAALPNALGTQVVGADVRNWQAWLSGTRYPTTASTEGWTDVFQQMEGRSFLLQTQMHLHHSCVDPTPFIWHHGPMVLNKDIAGLLLFLGFLSPGSWSVSWMWPLEILQRCSGTQQQRLGDSWPAFISAEAQVLLR